jgi:SnoaL-like domain
MGFHECNGPFSGSRRHFVQASAHAALGLMAGALGAAQASPDNSRAVPGNAANRGDSDMALSLQEISDRIEIEELLVRYCYAVDDRDWDAYRNLFTTDAVLDDTVTGGIRSDVEEHVSFMKKALSKILISQHAVSTILFDIRGDEASARVHCSCPMVVDLGAGKRQVFFQGLWYRDRLKRTPEGWRISELVEEGYWNHNVPEGFAF